MKGGKKFVWMLIAALLFSVTIVGEGTSSPETPMVYIDPQVNSAQPGETFSISVRARDVEDIVLCDISIAFDPGILEVSGGFGGIERCDQPNSFSRFYWGALYELLTPYGTWGMVRFVSASANIRDGLSGTVGLAKITFRVKSLGKTIITPYSSDIIMLEPPIEEPTHVEHFTEDGFFSNVNPVLWIKKKGAQGVGVKPEWHTGTVCTINTLSATVVNTGVEAANVRVVFVITGPVETVSKPTEAVTIEPGAKVTVCVTYHVVDPGEYTFYAYIEYEIRTWLWKNYKLECQEAFGGEGYTYDRGTGWFKATP